MRHIQMCLRLALPIVLGSSIVGSTQSPSAPAEKPAQTGAAKVSTAQTHRPAVTRHHRHRRHGNLAARNGKKRPDYRPEYSENSVEVINGDATKKVVFHDDQPAAAPLKKQPAGMKNAPARMKVEVVNGTATDTQYFYDNGQQTETALNQPVVVGIQSSDTRTVGGNKRSVVTSISSSGIQHAKSVSSGGEPVTKQVSPRPKRPAYRPDEH